MISVNGKAISDEEIAREAQYHPAGSLEEALHEAAVALVVRELLLQQASAHGIDGAARPTVDATAAPTETGSRMAGAAGAVEAMAPEERIIQALLEREIDLPVADEEALHRYYEANRERLRSPDLYEASHILFPAPAADQTARDRARTAALATLEELRREPSAFERLARQRSADPETREQGGHLGQITRGQSPPEIQACLDRLEPGEVCREPVETRYGYHVLRLDRVIRGRQLTFSMARDRIAEYLGASAWTRAVHQYIQLLIGNAKVEGIELAGSTSPLVQ